MPFVSSRNTRREKLQLNRAKVKQTLKLSPASFNKCW